MPPNPAKRCLVSSSARMARDSRLRRSMTGRGVPGATASPSQELNSTAFSVSPTVGTSGISG